MRLFILLLNLIGLAVIVWVDWRIAVALFFFRWASNLKDYITSPKYFMDQYFDMIKNASKEIKKDE